MEQGGRGNRAWLLAVARAVAVELRSRRGGTRLRIRLPRGAPATKTDGWSAAIGDLGKGKPHLEVWFDRFSGRPQRKLWAGFRSEERRQILAITEQVGRRLCPSRVITVSDYEERKHLALVHRLPRSEFSVPLLEKYPDGLTFYGFYDPTRDSTERVSPHFIARAAAFFESVARALPCSSPESEEHEVYPQEENRRRVVSHLTRERSRLLATERKIRDDYRCMACRLRFEDVYGSIGRGFAECHHLVPLSRLRGRVKTRIEDVRTVCANCHRMLHRMEDEGDHMARLRRLLRLRKPRRAR